MNDVTCRLSMAPSMILTWIIRVLGWDGLMPVLVWLSPILIRAVVPNNRGIVELTAVVVPAAAMVVRLHVGMRYIGSNRRHTFTRLVQSGVFILGLFLLGLIDCVIILSHIMPQGALFDHPGDRLTWIVLALIYLSLMLIAMYSPEAECRAMFSEGDQ